MALDARLGSMKKAAKTTAPALITALSASSATTCSQQSASHSAVRQLFPSLTPTMRHLQEHATPAHRDDDMGRIPSAGLHTVRKGMK